MNEAIELLERISGRQLDVRAGRGVAGDHAGRRRTRRGSRSDSAGSRSTSLEEGLRAQWEWAAVESPA